MKSKQIEFPSELAMVALAGFLKTHEILFERLFLRKRYSVNALQLSVRRVALPV